MKEKAKKIWKDPVFSAVIAALIIGVLSLSYSYTVSLVSKTDFESEFLIFWTSKIPLWTAVIGGLITLCIWWFFRSGYSSFKYDAETLALDRALFNRIKDEVLPINVIFQIKQSSLAENDFHGNILFKVLEILTEQKKSDFNFFNPNLEKQKQQLIYEVNKFRDVTGEFFFWYKKHWHAGNSKRMGP